MMSHRTLVALTVAALAAVVGCNKSSEASVPAPVPEAKKDGAKLFRAKVAPVTVAAGAKTKVTVTIEASDGLHFNEEYPASFTVADSALLKADKAKFTTAEGDVKTEGTKGVATLAMTAGSPGKGEVVVTGNFSVCSDAQCHILKGEKITLQVTVQ